MPGGEIAEREEIYKGTTWPEKHIKELGFTKSMAVQLLSQITIRCKQGSLTEEEGYVQLTSYFR